MRSWGMETLNSQNLSHIDGIMFDDDNDFL